MDLYFLVSVTQYRCVLCISEDKPICKQRQMLIKRLQGQQEKEATWKINQQEVSCLLITIKGLLRDIYLDFKETEGDLSSEEAKGQCEQKITAKPGCHMLEEFWVSFCSI
ncbi:unnamed protein product [Lepidochelys kempii]